VGPKYPYTQVHELLTPLETQEARGDGLVAVDPVAAEDVPYGDVGVGDEGQRPDLGLRAGGGSALEFLREGWAWASTG